MSAVLVLAGYALLFWQFGGWGVLAVIVHVVVMAVAARK